MVSRPDLRLLAGMRAGGEPAWTALHALFDAGKFLRISRQRRHRELEVAVTFNWAGPETAQSFGIEIGLR